MARIGGINFAPVSVPWERRTQTLGVFFFSFVTMFLPLVATWLLFYLFFTSWWYLGVFYLTYWYFDRDAHKRGGRRRSWVRNWWMWRAMADYFPVTLVKTADLNPDKNYLFACHPHGIFPAGMFVSFATEGNNFSQVFPGIKPYLLTLVVNCMWPGWREIGLPLGISSVDKSNLDYLLGRYGAKGEAACILIGGVAETLEAHCGSNVTRVVLKRRKGFVRMALRHGASLVPVFSFGETELYDQVDNPDGSLLRSLQEKLRRLCGVALALFHGRGILQYSFGMLPYRKPITVVVGSPIDVHKTESPTQDQVDSLHEQYVTALRRLFEENKTKYGAAQDQRLEII